MRPRGAITGMERTLLRSAHCAYLSESMTCNFQKPIRSTPTIPTIKKETMASRCCGNRLSLRNQYDTKTPRASLSLGGPGRPRSARRLSRSTLETYSRHESNAQRAFRNPEKIFQISREENFPEKFLRSARPPDS